MAIIIAVATIAGPTIPVRRVRFFMAAHRPLNPLSTIRSLGSLRSFLSVVGRLRVRLLRRVSPILPGESHRGKKIGGQNRHWKDSTILGTHPVLSKNFKIEVRGQIKK